MPPIDPDQTIVCELELMTAYSPFNEMSILTTYMLDLKEVEAIEPARIRAAAEGVARKWRLWAGRAEAEGPTATAKRTIRVPTGNLPADYPLITFSVITKEGHCPTQIPALNATSCVPLPAADLSLSTNAQTTKIKFDDVAAANSPLVAIVVTTFSDYQTIGLTFNHLMADGKGVGMYARAFSAELNGEPWTAPPLDTTNRVDAAFANVRAQLKNDPAAQPEACVKSGGIFLGMKLISAALMLKLVPTLVWDKLRHGTESSAIFMGEDVASWLVAKIKDEAAAFTLGQEYVTTNDILTAWFIKATFADDANTRPRFSGCCCIRDKLSHASPISLEDPEMATCGVWVYNQFWPAPSKTSLLDLALFHRRALLKERTIEQLSSAHTALSQARDAGKPCPLFLPAGPDGYGLTNQSTTGMCTSIDWGHGAGKKQYVASSIAHMDRLVCVNKVEHGWTWATAMRASRWRAAERELMKLQAEYEARG